MTIIQVPNTVFTIQSKTLPQTECCVQEAIKEIDIIIKVLRMVSPITSQFNLNICFPNDQLINGKGNGVP